jgi:3-deoxy-manno-octulosonate cytidylyltransferase (CMP-KDO synthetase)
MQAIGIIPARYASSRFPGKALVDIKGKSMIRRVYEQCTQVSALSALYVATDDQRIVDHVQGFGGKAILTSHKHQSGTDRCLEAVRKLQCTDDTLVVNIQGDEPFIKATQIELLLQCFKDENTQIATLIKSIENEAELHDPNRPKVVIDSKNYALYFSRSVIPFARGINVKNALELKLYYKHIGLYAYRLPVLQKIALLKKSFLENAESLEQLRWLENGYKIKTAITADESYCIDTQEDLEHLLKNHTF